MKEAKSDVLFKYGPPPCIKRISYNFILKSVTKYEYNANNQFWRASEQQYNDGKLKISYLSRE